MIFAIAIAAFVGMAALCISLTQPDEKTTKGRTMFCKRDTVKNAQERYSRSIRDSYRDGSSGNIMREASMALDDAIAAKAAPPALPVVGQISMLRDLSQKLQAGEPPKVGQYVRVKRSLLDDFQIADVPTFFAAALVDEIKDGVAHVFYLDGECEVQRRPVKLAYLEPIHMVSSSE